MRWDYGTRVERVLTAEEDFEEGIGRFLDDENGEPEVSPSDPSPEMSFPLGSADYETERYLAQRFGVLQFRQYFGLGPLLKHHGELRNLTSAMIRTRKNLEEIRTMVFRARAERLEADSHGDSDDSRRKKKTGQADVLRVCAWLRSAKYWGSSRSCLGLL
ncbi:hypothetical protein QFC20_005947 [Naganishia adeliensis]|uniref:Uncharacterized protein n=1 Tax=Naganishia adeliensis TaxID=92952 RepID=A0ACC2VHY1_9TREE|nr:hypothetical protein QFC20_005947 [Naganishia adeliensis]